MTARFTLTHYPKPDAYGIPTKGFRYRIPMQTKSQVRAVLRPQGHEDAASLDEIDVGEVTTIRGETRVFEIERTA